MSNVLVNNIFLYILAYVYGDDYCNTPILLCEGRVAIPVNGSCYYTIAVRQEKVIPIAKITNCIYVTFPTIVLCFTYKCPDKITGIKWERGRGGGGGPGKGIV